METILKMKEESDRNICRGRNICHSNCSIVNNINNLYCRIYFICL